MEKLKDIEVKKNDIVYFENTEVIEVEGWSDCFKTYNKLEKYYKQYKGRITKIERPSVIYEMPNILDKEEKEYLETVCRPFKNKVLHIQKIWSCVPRQNPFEVIWIQLVNDEKICLPKFRPNAMYKKMERCKEYTLKELGLFE